MINCGRFVGVFLSVDQPPEIIHSVASSCARPSSRRGHFFHHHQTQPHALLLTVVPGGVLPARLWGSQDRTTQPAAGA